MPVLQPVLDQQSQIGRPTDFRPFLTNKANFGDIIRY
jgi:hypothetical protein